MFLNTLKYLPYKIYPNCSHCKWFRNTTMTTVYLQMISLAGEQIIGKTIDSSIHLIQDQSILFAIEIIHSIVDSVRGEKECGRKSVIRTAKQTGQRPIKIQLLPLNSPLLEMQIIRDHLIVPDTGRAKLSPNSQRQPSNTLCPHPSGHPHTASLVFATSPRPPTQTLNPWRRPQANGEQGAPEWALDWPLSGPTAEFLYLHSL